MITPTVGTLLHVRTHTPLGWAIRHAQTRWLTKYCRKNGLPFTGWEIWGSHDGLIVPCSASTYGVGVLQAEPIGGVQVTPWDDELKQITSGQIDVRFFRVIGATVSQNEEAAHNGLTNELGKPYDWCGILAIEWKTVVGSFSDRLDDWTWADWCTEAVGNSWRTSPPALDIFQTDHPIPMTVEQCAGLLPRNPGRKTTLEEVLPSTEGMLKTQA